MNTRSVLFDDEEFKIDLNGDPKATIPCQDELVWMDHRSIIWSVVQVYTFAGGISLKELNRYVRQMAIEQWHARGHLSEQPTRSTWMRLWHRVNKEVSNMRHEGHLMLDKGKYLCDPNSVPANLDINSFITVPFQHVMCFEMENVPAIPERVAQLIERIKREKEHVTRLKLLYGWKCCLCGTTLMLTDKIPYCEVHHIKPLAEPHNGPDCQSNMITLCPNHHTLFDFGTVIWRDDNVAITTNEKYPICLRHELNSEYVDYYRTHIERNIHQGA